MCLKLHKPKYAYVGKFGTFYSSKLKKYPIDCRHWCIKLKILRGVLVYVTNTSIILCEIQKRNYNHYLYVVFTNSDKYDKFQKIHKPE